MKTFAQFATKRRRGFATDGIDLYKLVEGSVHIVEPTAQNRQYEINRLMKSKYVRKFDNITDAINFLQESYHDTIVNDIVKKSNYVDKSKAIQVEIEAEYNELLKSQPIPATIENLQIVLRYLNTVNWGSWKLPVLTIGYSSNQYDCDGKTATTIKLDEPISDPERGIENQTMFQHGAPRGHLKNYQRI